MFPTENRGLLSRDARSRPGRGGPNSGRIVFLIQLSVLGVWCAGYAQELCEQICAAPVYLATAQKWDGDFEERIKK